MHELLYFSSYQKTATELNAQQEESRSVLSYIFGQLQAVTGYSKGRWKVAAPFYLHGLLPVTNHQESYYAHRYIVLN